MAAATDHGTGIEWTHVPGYKGETWNPVRGCTKISPGCKHCYAETFAERWRGTAGHPYEQGFDLRLVPEKLDEPLRAKKPRAYFVNSMSDLHQERVGHEFVRKVYAVMQACPRHIFMVLTKRADVMSGDVRAMLAEDRGATDIGTDILAAAYKDDYVPSNIWLGVSVEDRKYGLPRVDILRAIPASVRFLSVEPLLEGLGDIDLTGIHWVIVGGESGPGARPCDLGWVRRVVAQCREQSVPVFVKQLGAAPTIGTFNVRAGDHHHVLTQIRNRKGGDASEWPEDLRVREFPKVQQGLPL